MVFMFKKVQFIMEGKAWYQHDTDSSGRKRRKAVCWHCTDFLLGSLLFLYKPQTYGMVQPTFKEILSYSQLILSRNGLTDTLIILLY